MRGRFPGLIGVIYARALAHVLGAICLSTASLGAQDSAAVVVRPWLLRDSSLAAVYDYLLKVRDSSLHERIVVRPGQTLSGIVYGRYQVGDTYRGVSGKLLRESVKELNGLPEDGRLRAGQTLYLPALPVFPERPGSTAQIEGMQVWEPRGLKVASADPDAQRLHDAPVWRLQLPQESDAAELQVLIARLGGTGEKSVWEAFLPFDVATPAHLPTPDVVTDADSLVDDRAEPLPPNDVLALQQSATLFVLDFFAEKCGHGQRVLDVVHQTLRGFGVTDAAGSPRIVTIEIDLRTDRRQKRRMIEQWLLRRNFDAPTSSSLLTSFDQRAAEAANANTPIVSLLHYMATMDSILSTPGARVVTSSFYVDSKLLGAFAAGFLIPAEAPVFFFSASGNEDTSLEDLADWDSRQPQRFFYDIRRNYPMYMVAGLTKNDRLHGVRSRKDPWAVPFIGQADNWGGRNTCIKPRKHIGTSYAAPAVAAALFGAINLWQSAGAVPRSRSEILNRFIAAATARARLSDTFAVPGLISTEKLLRAPGTYIKDDRGDIRFAATQVRGQVSYRTSSGESTRQFGGAGNGRVLAIVRDGAEVLVSAEDASGWTRAILTGADLDLPVAVRGCSVPGDEVCRIRTADDFFRYISELIVVQ